MRFGFGIRLRLCIAQTQFTANINSHTLDCLLKLEKDNKYFAISSQVKHTLGAFLILTSVSLQWLILCSVFTLFII